MQVLDYNTDGGSIRAKCRGPDRYHSHDNYVIDLELADTDRTIEL